MVPEPSLREYLKDHTLREAGDYFSKSARTIARWVAAYGLTRLDVKHADCVAFSRQQKELLLACMLGDGSIEPGGLFRLKMCPASKEYLSYVAGILGPFVKSGIKPDKAKAPICRNGKLAGYVPGRFNHSLFFRTITHPLFKAMRREWYPNGSKILPVDLPAITPYVVGHWYLQDGNNNAAYRQASISTCSFTRQEVERLQELLVRMGVSASIWRNGRYATLGFSGDGYDQLMATVRPFLTFACFAHKAEYTPRQHAWSRRVA